MIEVIFLTVLALVWIIFATVQDLKNKEIANWLNFSLIIFALGFRFFYSLFSETAQGFNFFYQGLVGLGVFFALGNLLYYGRMFAGGDAKLMIALGAILPFSESFLTNARIFILFSLIFLFVGGVYGFTISLCLSLKNFENFKKEFSRYLKKNRKVIYPLMVLGLALMILGFRESMLFAVGAFVFIAPYLFIYARAVDESCMIKKVKTSQLKEGDWLYRDLRPGKKIIRANWDGLSKKDIKIIKSRYKRILIRQGIPFTPVFFFSFLVIVYIYLRGSWLLGLLF